MISCKLKNEKIVELDMKGEVTARDYKKITPQLKKYFEQKGRMKFLIVLDGLKSMGVGAIWEDIKFDLQNLQNVGTTAIVGDKTSQAFLTKIIDTIFPAKVKYFDLDHLDDAVAWLKKTKA